MKIAIYVAVAENGVIGRDGGLPWRLSADLKRFKADTMGKPIVMGRKTHESIGRLLPGRRNVIVTRDRNYRVDGAEVVHSFDEALRAAERDAGPRGEACIIGGADIFALALPLADRLHVTHVLGAVDGDVRFPPIDLAVWRSATQAEVPPGEKDSHATRYVVYERRNPEA